MSAPALDHVGVVSRDLTVLAQQYEQLGFTLTPLARQTDGRIGNRCAMLQQGYFELLSALESGAGSATLDRLLARYAGIHILAFAMPDEQRTVARLRRGGFSDPAVMQIERGFDDSDPSGPHARFRLIALPEQPEGRINLVRHLTPEVLWQERLLRHPNNAVVLAEVIVLVSEPAEAAARLSRIAGSAVVPDPAGGFALDLPRGRVRLLTAAALSAVFSDVVVAEPPRVVGVTVQTSDGNQALRRLLAERGIAHRQRSDALLIDGEAAGGVALQFLPLA
jgi:hypothetical protein